MPASRKQERIPAFETHDPFPGTCQGNQLGVDRLLHGAVLTETLAHVALVGMGTSVEQRGMRQRVVQHGIRAREKLQAAHRDESGIAWACSNQIHFAEGHFRAVRTLAAALR